MKRKVLIIHKGGSAHTWCEDLRLGFSSLGHDAKSVALRDRTSEEKRIESTQGLRYLANPITLARLATAIRAHRPSIIVFLNISGLSGPAHEILREAARGAPFMGWLADHIENLPGDFLPNLDTVHSFDSATIPILQRIYQDTGAKIGFLPLAVNPDRFPHRGCAWSRRKHGLVFVGNHTADRIDTLRRLRELGATIACYGPHAASSWRIWRRRKIKPDETARLYGTHQFALNMLQFPNTINGVNLRAYEIPACGGLGTYPETPDLFKTFEPDREIITYRDLPSLIHQIEALSPEGAKDMLARSKKRVSQEHTYSHRAQSLINEVYH